VEVEAKDHILEGVLHCTNHDCQREYPILDGIPILLPNLRQYVADNILSLYGRRDLSGFTETLLGDCCGPNSVFDTVRQQLSSYTWEHYGDLDPKESPDEPRPGSMLAALEEGWQMVQPLPTGPILDAGCSVGRATFELAQKTNELVLGIDLNFPMLRLAAEVLQDGIVHYPRRRVGVVYERREFPARFEKAEQVDFWACDATALPLPPGSFSLVLNMNVLDCVNSPREFLLSIANVLRPRGKTALACPYDWSPHATAFEAWLGGHSQRSPTEGASEAVLRALLTPGAHPGSINTLRLTGERDGLPWHVRLHERSAMSYKLHLVAATRQ
jgi:SAM-dependent methyltransferase